MPRESSEVVSLVPSLSRSDRKTYGIDFNTVMAAVIMGSRRLFVVNGAAHDVKGHYMFKVM